MSALFASQEALIELDSSGFVALDELPDEPTDALTALLANLPKI